MAGKETFDAKVDQVKGGLKEAAGKLTDDKKLESEGKADKVTGKMKEGLEKAKDTIKGAIDDLMD